MSRLLQKVFAVALLAVAAHIAKCPTATAKGCFTSRKVHTTAFQKSYQVRQSSTELEKEQEESELTVVDQATSTRHILRAKSLRGNPYGARYSISAHEQSEVEDVVRSQRELAQGSLGAKDRRRRERRKVRKAKPDAQEMRGDEGKLQRTKSNDPSHPVFNEQQKSTNGAKPAGFDSSAVEDHMSTDEISLHQGAMHSSKEELGAKQGAAGEGQLGISGTEAAGGVDSSGVAEHFQEDATLLKRTRLQNGTSLDATGAEMPKQSRAAGVDSSGVASHISEDVGQDLLDKSGTTAELAKAQGPPRDATDREVVIVDQAAGNEDSQFSQDVIAEGAEGAIAQPEDNGDPTIAAAGVMPVDWRAEPSRDVGATEQAAAALGTAA